MVFLNVSVDSLMQDFMGDDFFFVQQVLTHISYTAHGNKII